MERRAPSAGARAVRLAHRLRRRTRGVSAAKHLCGTAGRAIALDVLQLHGAIGLQDETPISHYSKRLVGNDLLLGNASTHLGRFVAATDTVHGKPDRAGTR